MKKLLLIVVIAIVVWVGYAMLRRVNIYPVYGEVPKVNKSFVLKAGPR